MKKRFMLLLVMVAAVVTSLIGCTSAEEGKANGSGGETEITYYSFSAAPNYEEQLVQMVERF